MSKRKLCNDTEDYNVYVCRSLESNNRSSMSVIDRNKLYICIYYCMNKTRFEVENFRKVILPPKHRAALGKLGCGGSPIRIGTGRYNFFVLLYHFETISLR